MKLLIPLLCLAATLFLFVTRAQPQIMVTKTPMSYTEPWRVRFAYLEGSHIAMDGYMLKSYKTLEECQHNIAGSLLVLKVSPFHAVGIWCKVDGMNT